MGAIKVHEFMTLDGIIDAPMWTMDYEWTPRQFERMQALTDSCEAILLGRNTFEMFEPAWSVRTVEEDPGAPFFNDTMKHVVSGTLTETTWRNSQVLGPYDPERIRKLKDEVDGGIYISGSITLVRALLADGLIDELHLLVYPLTRGAGPRLFTDDAEPRKLTLADAERFDNEVLYVNYQPQA